MLYRLDLADCFSANFLNSANPWPGVSKGKQNDWDVLVQHSVKVLRSGGDTLGDEPRSEGFPGLGPNVGDLFPNVLRINRAVGRHSSEENGGNTLQAPVYYNEARWAFPLIISVESS